MNAVVKATPPAAAEIAVPHQGATLYRVSTEAAAICRDIVVATATNIQGRKYVQVEGWQAIALAHGCAASSGDVIRFDDGSVSATGRIIRIDTGTLISSAEGYVGADEPVWFGGSVTDRWGKTKILPKRADYAIRAMAQTRAISRACRSAFAHVVVMMNAGLSTTPAEEVPEEGFNQPAQTTAQTTGDAIPPGRTMDPAPKRVTNMQWLDALEAELAEAIASAEPRRAVDAILGREDVKKAEDMMTNGAKDRLEKIIQDANSHIAEVA